MQNEFTEQRNKLLQKIEFNKVKNQVLKDKWDRVKSTPPKNRIKDEISTNLMAIFIKHTCLLKELNDELARIDFQEDIDKNNHFKC
jgi:hypothetical protein